MAVAPFSLQTAALKPGDIATRLDVEPSTVYRWIRDGELASIEVAGAKYILATAFERFLERRTKGVTIEEQAERFIGPGVVEEYDGDFDPLDGLSLRVQSRAVLPTSPGETIEDARARFRDQLDQLEARFNLPSERVHRLRVEGEPHVEGVPDDLYEQWTKIYAAYLELSLVHAR